MRCRYLNYYSLGRKTDCTALRPSYGFHRRLTAAIRTLVGMSKRILLVAVVVTGMTAAAARPLPAAAAATPCWRQVVDDWFDGRIDRTYAPHCYRDALRHLPADARAYTTAAGDIQRAMLAAIRSYGTVKAPTRGPTTRLLQSHAPPVRARATQSQAPVRDETLFERAGAAGGSGSAATLPLPILVLGVVVGLLLTAAGTSRLARALRLRDRNAA